MDSGERGANLVSKVKEKLAFEVEGENSWILSRIVGQVFRRFDSGPEPASPSSSSCSCSCFWLDFGGGL